MIKLHIIQPTTYTVGKNLFQTRSRWVIGLTLPYLAALTDDRFDIKLSDERLESVDFSKGYDLVAITVVTRSSGRAYEIADMYRDMGIKVVMGDFMSLFTLKKQQCIAIRYLLAKRKIPGM